MRECREEVRKCRRKWKEVNGREGEDYDGGKRVEMKKKKKEKR